MCNILTFVSSVVDLVASGQAKSDISRLVWSYWPPFPSHYFLWHFKVGSRGTPPASTLFYILIKHASYPHKTGKQSHNCRGTMWGLYPPDCKQILFLGAQYKHEDSSRWKSRGSPIWSGMLNRSQDLEWKLYQVSKKRKLWITAKSNLCMRVWKQRRGLPLSPISRSLTLSVSRTIQVSLWHKHESHQSI